MVAAWRRTVAGMPAAAFRAVALVARVAAEVVAAAEVVVAVAAVVVVAVASAATWPMIRQAQRLALAFA
jgi:hypothetical protein